jgi:uncharacterized protein with GYD domain
MPAYIILSKFTQQGIGSIRGAPDRMKQAKSRVEQMGGRIIGTWVTMGEYDVVSVIEAPDDQTFAAGLLTSLMEGNRTTVTLKAFSEEEFAQIVSKLP